MTTLRNSWTAKQRELLAQSLQALAHPTRLAILLLLHEQGTLSIAAIQMKLNLDKSIISHHVSLLLNRNILGSADKLNTPSYFLKEGVYPQLIQHFNQIYRTEESIRYN